MSKRLTIIIGFLVVAMGSTAYLQLRPKKQPPESPAQPSNTSQTQSSVQTPAAKVVTGNYVNYSDSSLADAKGQKVLFFHAPCCPQCRSIEAGIESQGVPDGLTILKVDYDSHQALRQKYGVTIQTTFVKISEDGQFVSRFVAYSDPTFDSVKKNFL